MLLMHPHIIANYKATINKKSYLCRTIENHKYKSFIISYSSIEIDEKMES